MTSKVTMLLVGALFILSGITAFCLYEYIASIREKAELEAELSQIQKDIKVLELIRSNLYQDLEKSHQSEKMLILENTGLKDQIKIDTDRFTVLEASIRQAQENVEALNGQISVSRAENTALASEIEGLKGELSAAVTEKEKMSQTLNSVAELKKAIKALKIKTRQARRSMPVTIITDAQEQVREIILGNSGFLIKDGKSTYPSRVKIEVHSFSEISQ
ncbi:MAG: hypothetical protein MUC52_02220 [Candidatus Omnitrophica bacterium]|nr:hypothetical protein [Candidatus Omnitrophota bacterium]